MNMADYNLLWIYLLILYSSVSLTTAISDCPRGYFGWRCQLRCDQCLEDKCAPDTGECLSACKPGYTGHHCMFDDACKYDLAGITYTGHFSQTKQFKECVRWDALDEVHRKKQRFEKGDDPGNYCRNPLIVQSGGRLNQMWCYTDVKTASLGWCNIKDCDCPPHLFGPGCRKQCHCQDPTEFCSSSGLCPDSGCADGWIGSSCEKKCDHGKYGPRCKQRCSQCVNEACDHENGRCLEGCPLGYSGQFCDQACRGYFGSDCQTKCGKCLSGKDCDPKLGFCDDGCQDGYGSSNNTVRLCDITCESTQSYGPNCVHKCGSCKRGTICDPVDGKCPKGCQVGYSGAKCDSLCPSHFHGTDCLQRCGMCKHNSSCDPFTGRCPGGCVVGHQGFGCTMKVLANKSDSSTIAIGAGLGVGVLLILFIIILCFIYRRNRRKKLDVPKCYMHEIHDHIPREESCQLLGDSRIGSEPPSFVREEDDNMKNEGQEPIYVNISNKKQSSPVHVPDLYDYIMKNKEHSLEGFKREFEELPMGLLASCVIARKQENTVKNRYGNIVAYDHSRVVLDPLPGEPFSDYVNANFMDGYTTPKSYIASQGPNKVMIRDFWRMVWQQRVSKIVMLTNLTESCKKKCEQYWPDEGGNKYGDLTVLPVNTTKYTDFIIRTFEVSKEYENSRIVKQFHFTSWSDHGAPTYPTTLLAFRRKVLNFKPDDTAPILSHCSAGIGRTGTYIALDFLMAQAARENEVDVLKCAQMMRGNRVNMIQTLEQYIFVYEALLEGIISGNTTIPRSTFHSTYEDLVSYRDGEEELPIQKQYDVLQLLSPSVDRGEYPVALLDENINKNRFKNILPANRSRPFLYTAVEGCNDYINAVYLSGYTQKDQFIVTQMPLHSTVADFWRMMYDTSSDTIIMLNEFDRNDKSCALYWPEEYGYSEEHGPLSVELLSSSEADPDVTIRVFKLSHKDKGEERAIKQFMFKSWTDYKTIPNSVTPLLRLHRLVNEWLKQNSKGPVTMHCMNGASKSGVFAAMSLLLERLEQDFEVDVFQTAKQIRINRPQFIENLDQYRFLYQIMQEYLDQE